MSTDFLNELNSITKSKAEIEKDERSQEEKKWCKEVIDNIKEDIKTKASKGEFKASGTKKVISSFVSWDDLKSVVHEELSCKGTVLSSLFSTKTTYMFTRKATATKEFLRKLSLVKMALEQSGVRVIKISPAFMFGEKTTIANEIVYSGEEKRTPYEILAENEYHIYCRSNLCKK